jgi:hypothetical protein
MTSEERQAVREASSARWERGATGRETCRGSRAAQSSVSTATDHRLSTHDALPMPMAEGELCQCLSAEKDGVGYVLVLDGAMDARE